MKKLLMVLIASFALVSCGGSNRSEAERDAEDNTETTEPSVSDETTDTTTTTMGDTTATAPQSNP
jgi:uncharacterized protein YcfL